MTEAAAEPEIIPFADIALGEILGRGYYGLVYKALWGDLPIAVKQIKQGFEDKEFKREVKQLSKVSHENIIQLYGVSVHEKTVHLLIEYVEGGSLHNFLHAEWQPSYTLAHAISWALQIAEGVAYLHAMTPKAVIHRDIKPLNSLLGQRGLHVKICDFGTVVDMTSSMTNNRGTVLYMAPEVCRGRHYTELCDVHSWAMTLWEILSRRQPYENLLTPYMVIMDVITGQRPPLDQVMVECPEHIKCLIKDCWDMEPSSRHSMRHIVTVLREFMAINEDKLKPLDYVFRNQTVLPIEHKDS
ncbi:mitogen-activated protein kinase kinase kinase 7 [Drosophila subobscura]|uniref:mitogen-activated protein kinase kinase kinase 7 n=1 Tax=Drosophila subobscura TaxID=7241 RepID=UPI00155A666A|nr:mitogen-activated protein kinase kinase kinase 7 [Drosophila subobscura]